MLFIGNNSCKKTSILFDYKVIVAILLAMDRIYNNRQADVRLEATMLRGFYTNTNDQSKRV